MSQKTVLQKIRANAESSYWEVILRSRGRRVGDLQAWTWGELDEKIDFVAAGMIAKGLNPGDRVVLVSGNRLEMLVADLGVLAAGGILVGISPNQPTVWCADALREVQPRFVIVEDVVQLYKFQLAEARFQGPEAVFLMEGNPPQGNPRILAWSKLLEIGLDAREANRLEFESRSRAGAEVLAAITDFETPDQETGGVLVTHGHLSRIVRSLIQAGFLDPGRDRCLSECSLSSVFGRALGCYLPLCLGVPLTLGGPHPWPLAGKKGLETTVLFADSEYLNLLAEQLEIDPSKIVSFGGGRLGWAVRLGLKMKTYSGLRTPSFWLDSQYRLAKRLVLNPLKERLGPGLRLVVLNGLPPSYEMILLLRALDVRVLALGLAPGCMGGVMADWAVARSSELNPWPGFEMDLARDQEILVRPWIGSEESGSSEQDFFKVPEDWSPTGLIGRRLIGKKLKLMGRKIPRPAPLKAD